MFARTNFSANFFFFYLYHAVKARNNGAYTRVNSVDTDKTEMMFATPAAIMRHLRIVQSTCPNRWTLLLRTRVVLGNFGRSIYVLLKIEYIP